MSNLFILPTLLGDSILTTGAIDKYKDEPSTIIATPVTAALFADLPHLERVIILGKKPWKKHWFEMWKETHKHSWNRVVDFRGSALSLLLKAKKRHIWTHTTDSAHKVYQVTQCLKSKEILAPTLWFSEERLARVKPERPIFAIAPVPGWKGKQWPIENFVTLLTTFCKAYPEAQVAIFCAPSEKDLVIPLLKSLPKDQCIDTIGGNLLDSAALIQSSRLCIGNDSGLMHLSAAVRTPTIALLVRRMKKFMAPGRTSPSPPTARCVDHLLRGTSGRKKENTNCYMTDLAVPPVWEVVKERWEALGAENTKKTSFLS